MPLYNTTVELATARKVTAARLEPQGIELPFDVTDKGIRMTVDSFTCHQMVVLDYA